MLNRNKVTFKEILWLISDIFILSFYYTERDLSESLPSEGKQLQYWLVLRHGLVTVWHSLGCVFLVGRGSMPQKQNESDCLYFCFSLRYGQTILCFRSPRGSHLGQGSQLALEGFHHPLAFCLCLNLTYFQQIKKYVKNFRSHDRQNEEHIIRNTG